MAARSWLLNGDYDFILAVGDDWTDEDLFRALPEEAYSIRVGIGHPYARFNLYNYRDVGELLKYLGEIEL